MEFSKEDQIRFFETKTYMEQSMELAKMYHMGIFPAHDSSAVRDGDFYIRVLQHSCYFYKNMLPDDMVFCFSIGLTEQGVYWYIRDDLCLTEDQIFEKYWFDSRHLPDLMYLIKFCIVFCKRDGWLNKIIFKSFTLTADIADFSLTENDAMNYSSNQIKYHITDHDKQRIDNLTILGKTLTLVNTTIPKKLADIKSDIDNLLPEERAFFLNSPTMLFLKFQNGMNNIATILNTPQTPARSEISIMKELLDKTRDK